MNRADIHVIITLGVTMAYNEEKHAFEQLTADMKAGDIPAVVILRGSEEYLVDFMRKH